MAEKPQIWDYYEDLAYPKNWMADIIDQKLHQTIQNFHESFCLLRFIEHRLT